MNRESKPSSSTVAGEGLDPAGALRRRRPPRCRRAGRRRTGRCQLMGDGSSLSRSASSAAIVRVALGEERGGALEHVVGGEDPDRGVELGGQAGVEVHVRARRRSGAWPRGPRAARARRSRSPMASRPRRRASPAGHDPVDEADPLRLRGVRTRPVRISSLARASPTTRGSRCVPPAPGMTASRTSGRPSRARSRGDPQVAAQRELQPAAERVALDRRDRRHRQLGEPASTRPPRARAARGRLARAAPRTRRRASRPRTPARRARCTTTARTSPGGGGSERRQRVAELARAARAVTRLSGGLTSSRWATRPSSSAIEPAHERPRPRSRPRGPSGPAAYRRAIHRSAGRRRRAAGSPSGPGRRARRRSRARPRSAPGRRRRGRTRPGR